MSEFISELASKMIFTYYLVCTICVIICAVVFIAHTKTQKKYELEKEAAEHLKKIKQRQLYYPDFYYNRKRISAIIIVPRLPDPSKKKIQQLLLNGYAFCLESEYITVVKGAPQFYRFDIWLYGYTDKDGNIPTWIKVWEHTFDSTKNIGATQHPLSEIWSPSYLEYIESGRDESDYELVHVSTRSKPIYMREFLTDECITRASEYRNYESLMNNTYHDMVPRTDYEAVVTRR